MLGGRGEKEQEGRRIGKEEGREEGRRGVRGTSG